MMPACGIKSAAKIRRR